MDLKKLRQDLIRQERMKLKAYICPAGKMSIGVGRNLEDVGISEEEALILLDHDIQRTVVECQKNFPFWFQLNTPRKNVLLNMCFNMGMSRLRGFKKMIAALEKRDYVEASNEMLTSVWSAQVGKRAVELAETMQTGEFPY